MSKNTNISGFSREKLENILQNQHQCDNGGFFKVELKEINQDKKNEIGFTRVKLKDILKQQQEVKVGAEKKEKIEEKQDTSIENRFTKKNLKEILKAQRVNQTSQFYSEKLQNVIKVFYTKYESGFYRIKLKTISKEERAKKIFYKKLATKILLIVYILSACLPQGMIDISHAIPTTPGYAGTVTNIGGGSFTWSNTINAIGNTTTTAATSTITTRNAYTDRLSLTNFNLGAAGLPAGATINGIQVDIETQASGNGIKDTTVQLTKDGTNTIGNNYGNNTNRSSIKTTTTYGGLTDLWGTTWTYQELLSSNFGVIVQYRDTNSRSRTINLYRVWITIDYTPNASPSDITLSNSTIPSSLPIGSLIGNLSTTDTNTTDTHTYGLNCSTPGADDSSFAILGDKLNSNEVFDHTIKSIYNICIRTDDGFSSPYDENFTITILAPVPNTAPSDISLSNQNIFEAQSVGTLVGTLSNNDPDTWNNHTYSFGCSSSGADDSSFVISDNNLNSNQIFNNNSKSSYNICIRVDDNNGGTFDENFTINVRVLDFEITGGYTVSSGIFNRVTSDFYEGTYSIESDNQGIDNSSSCFEANREIDVDSTIKFYRKVSSEANYDFLRFYIDDVEQDAWSGEAAWSEVSYNISTGNHDLKWCYEKDDSVANGSDKAWVDYVRIIKPNPPTDILLTSNSIDEGQAIGSNVGVLSSVDADAGDTHTYSFTCDTPGVDDASFAISGSNLNSNAVFNYDTKSTYNICIRTDDGNLGTYDKNFTININDINLAPTDIILSSNSITEGNPIGSLVGTLSTIDGDSSDTHTYGFTCSTPGVDDSSFSISGTNLNSNEVFNFATKSSYAICIRTDDGNGGTYDKNFTININELLVSPGGVSNNMELWLRADKGTSTTTDGNNLTTWNDYSGNGLNASGGVPPTYYNTSVDLNYNPVVDFNGTNQYLENLNNGVYTQSYFAVVVPDSQVDGTVQGQVPFAFDCNAALYNTGGCGLTFGGLVLGAFTAAINDEVITHAIGASTNWRSAQIGQALYEPGKPMLINMNENADGTGTEISEKGLMLDNYNANSYQTLGATDYRIGMSTDPTYPFAFDGKIAEIINYSSRTNSTDKLKIESYLSLKYGMTISNNDYIASDGTTYMWRRSIAGSYVNNIFGIGRDDQSELSQIKSKSIDSDNVITIEAIGEGTNASPSFTDIDNKEFLSIANNGLGNTWAAADAPNGYFILDRKWRAQETGEVGNINIDFNVANSNFDIPATSSGSTYYFIYDSNNNNSLADETPTAMTNTSGSIWQIAGVNINHLTEFTIATIASTNHIPTNISLSNNSINENVIAGSVIGSFSTTDVDSGDSHTYTLVSGFGDNDNMYLNISGTSISIIHSPDYEIKQTYSIRVQTDDGNGGQYQKAFTIYINNLGEAVTSSLDFENPLDDYKFSVTSGNWSRTTTNPYEGLYSFESDNGGTNSSQSCFEVNNKLTKTGSLNYYYYVSSQAGSDFLRFYVDNVQQQQWSGSIGWTQYTQNDIAPGDHIYKWCYVKDASGSAGTDNAYIDFVASQPSGGETTPPNISGTNYASGTLLPGGNHSIIINYSDAESGIDINSDTIELYKWNGSSWGTDISSTGFNLGSKSVTTTSATYPTNNLDFGKYRFDFSISDNDLNSSSISSVFYIDIPEMTISTGSIDIGGTVPGVDKFSEEVSVTVKTVGAAFDIVLNKSSPLSYSGVIIQDWDGSNGFGYDQNPYSSNISIINSNQIIGSQPKVVNTDGNRNTYIYNIKLGTRVGEEQAAGNYLGNIDIDVNLDY